MINNSLKKAAAIIFSFGLFGCATPERIVLLPQTNGAPSAVIIKSKTGEEILTQPYAVAEVSGSKIKLGRTDEATIKERYETLSDALPPRPRIYLLFFDFGGTTLTAESTAKLNNILEDLKNVPAADFVVIGHTDKYGSDQINDEISKLRANKVKELMINIGIPGSHIETVGRGRRDSTNLQEDAKNRSVEIRLR